MKKLLFLAFVLLMGSCTFNRIGSLTMVSTRNMDTSANYVELARGVEGRSKMRHDDALQEAIDDAINSVPGGEYMMNTIVYVKDNRIIKVKGDVWGKGYKVTGSDPTSAQLPEIKKPEFEPGQKVKYIDSKKRKVNATVQKIDGEFIIITLDHNQTEIKATKHDLIKI